MVLKAVFLEFSGVIIKDTSLQRRLINEILVNENLRPDPVEFAQVCFGRSDRRCLEQLLSRRGRVTSEAYLEALLAKKAAAYIQALSKQSRLPLYPGLEDFLYALRSADLPIGIVTGAQTAEVEWVLSTATLSNRFAFIITGETLPTEAHKPAITLYEQAVAQLQQQHGSISASECLAVEASFAGIYAAQQAGIPVVGVAQLYPFRMMQRRADWAVDYLNEIDISWIQDRYCNQSLLQR